MATFQDSSQLLSVSAYIPPPSTYLFPTTPSLGFTNSTINPSQTTQSVAPSPPVSVAPSPPPRQLKPGKTQADYFVARNTLFDERNQLFTQRSNAFQTGDQKQIDAAQAALDAQDKKFTDLENEYYLPASQ